MLLDGKLAGFAIEAVQNSRGAHEDVAVFVNARALEQEAALLSLDD